VIIAAQGATATSYAAGLARDYSVAGYPADWYLPSKDELYKLYFNHVAIGGFNTTTNPYYWSSSEVEGFVDYAWYQGFVGGYQNNNFKDITSRVRAVRSF
jgi:hypothetical protein